MSDLTGNYTVTRGGKNVGSLTVSKNGLLTVFDCICTDDETEVLRLAAVSGGEYIIIGVMMPDGANLRLKKSFTKNTLEAMGLYSAAGFYLIRQGEIFGGADAALSDVSPLGGSAVKETVRDADEPAVFAEPAPDGAQQVFTPADETEGLPDPVSAPVAAAKPVFLPQPVTVPHGETDMQIDGKWKAVEDPSILLQDRDIGKACRGIKGALTAQENGLTLLAVPISPTEPFPMMPVFCFGSAAIIGGRSYIIFNIKNGYLSV